MTAYRPTRLCPHRLCRPLHLIAGIGGLLAITAMASVSLWILGSFAVGILFSFGVYHLVHGQSMVNTVLEEVQGTAVVIQRPFWARAAVAVDALWAVATLMLLVSVLTDRSSSELEATPSPVGLLGSIAVGVFLMGLTEVLHRRGARVEVRKERTAA